MKKAIFLLIFSIAALSANAQNQAKYKQHRNYQDSLRWCFEVNTLLGLNYSQKFATANTAKDYTNVLNAKTGTLKYSNGTSFGAEGQFGLFFGHKKHFGIGTGVIYLQQKGDAVLDTFHIEYQSKDFQGKIFRQEITSNQPLKESLNISNINIPLVIKYKNRFSKLLGITADVGMVYNMELKNEYHTNASFDYEAIYQYVTNSDGTQTAVYDNSLIPSNTKDWFITKTQYLQSNPSGMVAAFDTLRRQGYNVGLGVKPNKNSGTVSSSNLSIGLLVRPQLSFYISEKLAINVGGYFMYQPFKNSVSTSYRVTDKVGEYSSILNSVASSNSQSYGINLGLRYGFGKSKVKDSDGDGTPDGKDRCPYIPGPAVFDGCPDTDGDGIPDIDDSCPHLRGSVKFHGCPDSDGDGIPDREDSCPHEKGLPKLHGCPDSDGDGIMDKLDACSFLVGTQSNHGCPEYLFKDLIEFPKDKIIILKSSESLLDSTFSVLQKNPKVDISIDGFSDKPDKSSKAKKLSDERSEAIKKYLVKKGADPSRLLINGKRTISDSKVLEKSGNQRPIIKIKYRMG